MSHVRQRGFPEDVVADPRDNISVPLSSTSALAEGDDRTGVKGRNDFQGLGYGGPCPPPNHGSHRYFFKLFALDVESLSLEEGATREAVEQALQGHVLDQTELMGQYRRGPDKL